MAEPVVDVVAEKIKEKHVANDVHKTAVQKSIAYELPQVRPGGREHKMFGPGAKYFRLMRKSAHVRPVA